MLALFQGIKTRLEISCDSSVCSRLRWYPNLIFFMNLKTYIAYIAKYTVCFTGEGLFLRLKRLHRRTASASKMYNNLTFMLNHMNGTFKSVLNMDTAIIRLVLISLLFIGRDLAC